MSCTYTKLLSYQVVTSSKFQQNSSKCNKILCTSVPVQLSSQAVTSVKTTFCDSSSNPAVLYTVWNALLGFAGVWLGLLGSAMVCYSQHDSWQMLHAKAMILLRVQQMHDCTIADGPCKPWSANESHWENGSSKKQPNQYRAPLSVKINCRDCTPQELNNRHFLNMIDPQHASWLKYVFALVQVACAKSHLWFCDP